MNSEYYSQEEVQTEVHDFLQGVVMFLERTPINVYIIIFMYILKPQSCRICLEHGLECNCQPCKDCPRSTFHLKDWYDEYRWLLPLIQETWHLVMARMGVGNIHQKFDGQIQLGTNYKNEDSYPLVHFIQGFDRFVNPLVWDCVRMCMKDLFESSDLSKICKKMQLIALDKMVPTNFLRAMYRFFCSNSDTHQTKIRRNLNNLLRDMSAIINSTQFSSYWNYKSSSRKMNSLNTFRQFELIVLPFLKEKLKHRKTLVNATERIIAFMFQGCPATSTYWYNMSENTLLQKEICNASIKGGEKEVYKLYNKLVTPINNMMNLCKSSQSEVDCLPFVAYITRAVQDIKPEDKHDLNLLVFDIKNNIIQFRENCNWIIEKKFQMAVKELVNILINFNKAGVIMKASDGFGNPKSRGFYYVVNLFESCGIKVSFERQLFNPKTWIIMFLN